MPNFDAPSGDLPLLLNLEEGEWHEIEVDLDSVVADKNEKGWSCYLATINGNLAEEIPFWAMSAFYEFVDDLPKKQQTKTIEIRYKRTLNGKKNTAQFKEA